MVNYGCETCGKIFKQKGHLNVHTNRKNPCKKDNTIEEIIAKKVQEALSKMNIVEAVKFDATNGNVVSQTIMDYTSKSISELKTICRKRKIKGFSGKSSEELVKLIQSKDAVPSNMIVEVPPSTEPTIIRQDVILGDTIAILPTFASDSAQIIIADPRADLLVKAVSIPHV